MLFGSTRITAITRGPCPFPIAAKIWRGQRRADQKHTWERVVSHLYSPTYHLQTRRHYCTHRAPTRTRCLHRSPRKPTPNVQPCLWAPATFQTPTHAAPGALSVQSHQRNAYCKLQANTPPDTSHTDRKPRKPNMTAHKDQRPARIIQIGTNPRHLRFATPTYLPSVWPSVHPFTCPPAPQPWNRPTRSDRQATFPTLPLAPAIRGLYRPSLLP